MTLLVTSRHPVREYTSIATQLLSTGHVHAEQVGFVRTPTSPGAQVRLHMAGDEFCGNACLALAALKAAEQGLVRGEATNVVVQASGADALVNCRVERRGAGYECELEMPPPQRVEPYSFPGAGTHRSAMVRYADAAHLVVECDRNDPLMRERALRLADHLGRTEGVPVVGVMLFDPASHHLDPLINVPALDSTVWERSCASGTASIGAHLAATSKASVSASVRQPGGTMHVRAGYDSEGLTTVHVAGHVRVVAEGTAYVHD
ncbi:hypothetical protein BJH93_07665 [Kocuria polaris]|nr:hypothetical protein [Kocuria polaris]